MPEGIGYGPNSNSIQSDQQFIQRQAQSRDTEVAKQATQEQRVDNRQSTENVEAQEALRADTVRTDQNQQTENVRQEAPVVSSQLQAPDANTIRQLESNAADKRQQSQGASGLGQTALNSYNRLQADESSNYFSKKIKVDITA